VPGDRNDFMQLAPTHYTVQVARSGSLDALAAPEGLSPCYIIEVGEPSQRQMLLLCGDHADAASARATAAAAGVSGWPRRIGPLQEEARRID
jgi:hypothetical protein